MPAVLKHGMTVLLLSVCCIVLAYFYIDKLAVLFAYQHHLRQYAFLGYLTQLALVFISLPLLFYPYLVIRRAYSPQFSATEKFLLVLSNSVAISFFLKEILKLICSRYWPMTWKGNLSLIKQGAYGFNWFQFSAVNNSFPSGHAAIAFAGLSVLAIYFRKLRWFLWLIGLVVLVSLVAEYFHFVSDVIAGACIGYLVAYYNMAWIMPEKISNHY